MVLASDTSDDCEFRIREASYSDLDKIIEINMRSLPEHYPRYFWEQHIEEWGKIFLVAEAPGGIIGYMMNRIENDEGFFKGDFVLRGHVVSIAVLREYRRRGVGKALMLEGMYRMKKIYGAEEVVLEVRVSNEPATNLYRSLGFKVVRILRRYYMDGEDAYLMAAPL
ncbi:MAG: ribosomal protein S18-alanine N-acetyltransferase [Sulfolobales archaeon]